VGRKDCSEALLTSKRLQGPFLQGNKVFYIIGVMPTIQVEPGSDLELQGIADIMGKSRKVIVVTGAGISTNCGIPVS
jgi:accessory colonization factor AcfC